MFVKNIEIETLANLTLKFVELTARVLSSLKILGLRPRILKLDKTLLFVF